MTPRATPRILLPVVAVLAALLLGGAPATASGSPGQRLDLDCADFATQADAQRYFLRLGGPDQDPDNLDADGDGVACESNPCPCSTDDGKDAGGGPDKGRRPLKVHRGVVVKVVDGDTVDVRLRAGKRVRVRLLGIDTPEVHGRRECGGPQASTAMKRMLPRGQQVVLTSDRTQSLEDRYGRWLRYVQKARSRVDVGRVQLHRGHARVFVFRGDPFTKVRRYRAEERSARRADRGLWGRCR